MKNIIIIVILVILLGAAFFFTRQYLADNPGGFFGGAQTVTINEEKINITVANTPELREKGLSGRDSLPENEGMFFTFDTPGYYGFWMKDMKFPIDIIFMKDGRVVTIFQNVQPAANGQSLYIYKPEEPINQVLELNANKSEELNIQKGDTIPVSL